MGALFYSRPGWAPGRHSSSSSPGSRDGKARGRARGQSQARHSTSPKLLQSALWPKALNAHLAEWFGERTTHLVSETAGTSLAELRRVRLCELVAFDATGVIAYNLHVPFPRERADAPAATRSIEVAAREVSTQESRALAPGGASGVVVSYTNVIILTIG